MPQRLKKIITLCNYVKTGLKNKEGYWDNEVL